MMRFFFLLLMVSSLSVELCWGLVARRADDRDFEVVSNPHDDTMKKKECQNDESNNVDAITSSSSSSSSFCSSSLARNSMNLDSFLEPYFLITQVIPTQADTFQKLSFVQIMSVPVPTYHMKQPARLSQLELEYQLILTKELSMNGQKSIQVVPVDDPQQANDSWFPGFFWSPLVMRQIDSSGHNYYYQHVGWKFTKKTTRSGDETSLLSSSSFSTTTLPYFYALMIEPKNPKEQEVVTRLSGFKAPGWMAQRIIS
jgi:hypothetical protein